jgi:hypothetical protein
MLKNNAFCLLKKIYIIFPIRLNYLRRNVSVNHWIHT